MLILCTIVPQTPKQSQSCLICFNYQHKMPSVWDVIGQRCTHSSVNTAVNKFAWWWLWQWASFWVFPFFFILFSALAFWIFLIFHLFNKLLWSWNQEVCSNISREDALLFAKRIISKSLERGGLLRLLYDGVGNCFTFSLSML